MFVLSLILMLLAVLFLGVALWNALRWPSVAATRREARAQSLSVLIPARDEEANVGACLDTALAQGAVVREILVYDDHSADATRQVVGEHARRDARVRIIAPSELPAGWCGKSFACARLAAEARGEWLLFLDADARLCPGAAARIINEAESRKVTLLSCWPALELKSFWEKVLMPLLNFVVFTLYPAPLALRRTDPSLGLAHGSCLLARRDAYERTGGHELVRAEIFEDTRLAQVWRARGESSLCLDGQGVVSVRMYRSLAEIWGGFRKNFFPAFRRESSFWAFVSLHFAVFLLPFVLAPFVYARAEAWLLIAAAICVLTARAALAQRFKHPWFSVLLHPLGEAFMIALGLSSWWACRTSRGVEWKGRRYYGRTSEG